MVKEFGQLEVTLSSTQLQALTDAVLYLVAYPYECSEQVASRLMAVAGLRDVLAAFSAPGLPPVKELEARVGADVKLLATLQNYDGGFAFWRKGDDSWPYLSIHVAHALVRAKAKGFAVPADMLERSQRYLSDIESHISYWYPLSVKRSLIAYALSVRKRMGDVDTARAKKLIAEATLDKLPLEAVGWLLYVLSGDASSRAEVAAIHRFLDNRVTETAGAAHYAYDYKDGNYLILGSDRRTDAIVLEALLVDAPMKDVVPKIVAGLLAHRTRGHWLNTQENVFALLAMDAYFHAYEKTTPNFVARAWLGELFAGEQKFVGRSIDRHEVRVPMAQISDTKQDLTIQKQGAGRLYYRIGMTYAPENLELGPADQGFVVEREYEAVDNPGDVTREKSGTWTIRSGARVRVRLTMVATSRRYHVALVDPLPAGLEAQNSVLATTGPVPSDPKEQKDAYWWWTRAWYEHENLRDERVEAFTTLLWEGVHTYSYVARATTPGQFVVPPAKAEEMYAPETFGRSASDRVVIK